ncbi:inactive hydroxysteroid dehydrogenase-like protein 1 [Neocloeon triangulifer]|uniref:inactive hydroxysteroid dehydrogenase-like protein 1 n=1 Tax=Neocloeon triangulifer TaxID=2078957 RepID=UPI00286F4A00|nr:inactive hydroxysteroid dehydrogenase-like protein 1 [Neocloeon triangulifer]
MLLSAALLALATVGLVVVATFLLGLILTLLTGLTVFFLGPALCSKSIDLKDKFGTWAVVTGSTDGIGRAYAEELAKRGINLVLVSRSIEKLSAVAAQLGAKYNVLVRIIVADFSKGESIYESIDQQLADIPVGILVNNVGSQYSYPMYVGEVPPDQIWSIININIGATTMMTRIVLRGMKLRGKGAIVNMSSGSECQPLPFMTIYAASKVFVKSFSAALRNEYQDSGITVQHLSPLFINTKMNAFSHRLQEDGIFVPSAATYAKSAINTLGKLDHTTGYWAHGIQYWFTEFPPVWMRTIIGGLINKGFRNDYFKGMQNNNNMQKH